MTWAEQLIRIRRLIRDPEGLIWSEGMLLRIFNDEQNDLLNQMPVVQNVQALQIPPEFSESYTFDHEWSMATAGEVYRFAYFYDADNYAHTAAWEPEHLKGYSATTSAEGTTYTHPWEAWLCDMAEPAPIPLPSDFHSMIALYWDKQPVDPSTKSEVMAEGGTCWKTEGGTPEYYWRDDEDTNWIYLFPMPDAEWATSDAQADPDVAEYATTTLDIDGNLMAIYDQEAVALVDSTDESVLPAWMQKYIEYGVAARAFRANTDGQITSLADYWDLRKMATMEAIKLYRLKRIKDRSLCMATQDRSAGGRSRRPRLPSTYPAVD